MNNFIKYSRDSLKRKQSHIDEEKKLLDQFEKSEHIHINLPTTDDMKKFIDSLNNEYEIINRLIARKQLNQYLEYYEKVIEIYTSADFVIIPPDINNYPERITDKNVSEYTLLIAKDVYDCIKSKIDEVEKL